VDGPKVLSPAAVQSGKMARAGGRKAGARFLKMGFGVLRQCCVGRVPDGDERETSQSVFAWFGQPGPD